VDVLSKRSDALRGVEFLLEEITAEGGRMGDEFRTRAKRMIDDQALAALETLAGSTTDAELDATVQKLQAWWKEPDFVTAVEIWQERACDEIERWFVRGADQLERSMKTPRFQEAVPDAKVELDADWRGKAPDGRLGKLLRFIATPLKGAKKEVVYAIGKALGCSFKPWGATNLAKILGTTGVVLGVLSVVVDIVDVYRSWKHEKRRIKLRSELRDKVLQSAEKVYDSLVATNEDATGPIAYLNSVAVHFSSMKSDLDQELLEKEAEIKLLKGKIGAYQSRMSAAWKALNL
jgi:hypothetical protein